MSAGRSQISSQQPWARTAANRLLERWQDPTVFCEQALGIQLWDRQAEAPRSVLKHSRVAVRSGHKTGKSTGAAATALWWLVTKPAAKVVLTAPAGHQISNILWPEVRRLYNAALLPIGGRCSRDPFTGLELPDGRRCFAVAADTPETIAGISGENLLIVVDEASGYDERLWEAIFGNQAGGGHVLALGNPTQTSGTFFDAFHSKREFWHTVHISSEETPNVVEGRVVVPGLATREWIEERKREWGEDSPFYRVRVAGDFPGQGENAVIPLSFVEAAIERWPDAEGHGPLVIGVDVARYGDDSSVLQPRRGLKALAKKVIHGQDTMQVAGAVVAMARELRKPGERVRVNVDVIGVGAGVADRLKEDPELDVSEINVAESATGVGTTGERYARLRDQLWFGLRAWLRDGGAIENDDKTSTELVAPRFKFDARGQYLVESKDDTKRRLKRSPDRADALCLAVYDLPPLRISDEFDGDLPGFRI